MRRIERAGRASRSENQTGRNRRLASCRLRAGHKRRLSLCRHLCSPLLRPPAAPLFGFLLLLALSVFSRSYGPPCGCSGLCSLANHSGHPDSHPSFFSRQLLPPSSPSPLLPPILGILLGSAPAVLICSLYSLLGCIHSRIVDPLAKVNPMSLSGPPRLANLDLDMNIRRGSLLGIDGTR